MIFHHMVTADLKFRSISRCRLETIPSMQLMDGPIHNTGTTPRGEKTTRAETLSLLFHAKGSVVDAYTEGEEDIVVWCLVGESFRYFLIR